MLKAENITVRIGNKVLLDNVDTQFQPGKLNLIIGPNGAGKSTLMKVLSRQMDDYEGVVTYQSVDSKAIPDKALARMRAVLSQNIDLAFPLKVWEVVMMGRYPHFSGAPRQLDEEACVAALKFFEVEDMAERNYLTLSGGERQRVHFARVLTQLWYPMPEQGRYLLLDEPLTFLDIHYQFQFMRKVIELLQQKDLVVVGVVHDLNLAARFGDVIHLIQDGRLVASGSKEEVLTEAHIEKAFRLKPIIYREKQGLRLFFE
ncbi:MAG: heme ABC transporter ATP-binding protein [Cyclobacteriaceae bacterium]|nr:heme ABC transporter ATP-binding protein [Cyclobacteriaceae bacterium]